MDITLYCLELVNLEWLPFRLSQSVFVAFWPTLTTDTERHLANLALYLLTVLGIFCVTNSYRYSVYFFF